MSLAYGGRAPRDRAASVLTSTPTRPPPPSLQAAAAIIVYDITKATSFNTLKNWVRELQQLGPENIVIAVCGNKADLESKRVRAACAAPLDAALVRHCS